MKRHLLTALLLTILLSTAACSESKTAAAESGKLMQVSSIRWDEVAAADHAAMVGNNSLIMMR